MSDKVVVVQLAGGKVLPAELYSADGKREKVLNIHALIEGIDDAGKVLIVSVDKNVLTNPPLLTKGNDLRARLIINAEGKILRNLGPVRRTIRPKISPGGKYVAVMELNPDGSNRYWWKIHVYCTDRENDRTIDDRDACLVGILDNGDVLVRTTNPKYLSSTTRSNICRLVQIDAKGRSRILVEDFHDAYLVGSKVYCLTTDNQGLKVADVLQPGSKADMPCPEIWRKYPHLKEKLDADLSRMEKYLKSLEPEAFAAKHPELVKMAKSDNPLQRARAIKAISALRDKSALSIVVAAMKKCNLSREGPQSLRLANLQPLLSLTDWIYDAYHPDRKTPRELAPLLPLFVKMLVEAGDKPNVRCCYFQAIGCLAGPEWLPLVKDLSASRHPAVTHWSAWAVKEVAKRARPTAKPAKESSP